MRKLSSRENGGKDGSINYGVMVENICEHKKANWSWNPFKLIREIIQIRCQVKKELQEGANYCKEHGCRVCGYANLKFEYQTHSSDVKIKVIRLRLELGEESVCSVECKAKADTKFFFEEVRNLEKKQKQAKLIVEISRLSNDVDTQVKNVSLPFFNIISGTSINDLKLQLIKEEITEEEFINKVSNCVANVSLESAEKESWKKIYSEISSVEDLVLVGNKEREFFLLLVKKIKSEEKEKQGIVKEINTELNYFSPQVDLKELPETYHNFASLKTPELRKVKSKIIEAIKNKREEKKLLAFLDKETSCADNELLSLIQDLEKFASVHASQHEKNAYCSQKDKVDSLLNRLRERWNNLGEEDRLNHLLDNACRNFDKWIEEGENLVLSDNCPFYDFKRFIRTFRSESEIESQQKQAFEHCLEKFKKDVKKQLVDEELDDEFQEIDNSKDFSEVKVSRDNIKEGRKKSLKEFKEQAISKLQGLLDEKSEDVNLDKVISSTWKEDLGDLKSKREVNSFAKNMVEEINNALIRRDKPQNQEENNQFLFSYREISIISGFFVILAILLILAVKIKNICLSLVGFSE